MRSTIFDAAFSKISPAIREKYAVYDEECCDLLTTEEVQVLSGGVLTGRLDLLRGLEKEEEDKAEILEAEKRAAAYEAEFAKIRANEANWNYVVADSYCLTADSLISALS